MPTLVEDINCLASTILQVMNDETIELSARGIAQYMLLCEKISLPQAQKLIRQRGAIAKITKLLDSQTDFMGPTPRAVGIDVVSENAAKKIQQSLDVKHVKKHNNIVYDQLDRIKPLIKIDLAYTHPNLIWVRFYSTHKNITIHGTTQKYNILPVCENVYEAYGKKDINDVFRMMTILERDYNADLIFCSELPAFLSNSLLFLSNYVKFTWCYSQNRNIFDPTSAKDIREMLFYCIYGLLFLNTNNLTSMPKSTHGPLIACTGERPKIALSKFERGKVFVNEGSRAMQTVNQSSDFGTISNYIEFINEIELDVSFLSKII